MNGKRRLITLCALAFVLSGAATLALSWRMAHVAAAESQRTRSYVAPARLIPAGEPLQAADLRMVAWPSTSPLSDGFDRVNDAVGRTTLYPLAAGQPVLEHDLTPRGAGPGLAGRIPDGMRALAIRSDEVVGVGGFLSPGLHVDMLVTLQSNGIPQTGTVLENALVVAVGQQSEPDPTGKPSTATVVTLLLTPEQAQRALLSSSQGTVHFVLRNSGDNTNTHAAPATLADLGAAPVHPAQVAPATAPPLAGTPAPHVSHHAASPRTDAEPALPEVVLSGRPHAPAVAAEGKQ